MKLCSVEGCKNKHNSHGYCSRHYKQYLNYGETWLYSIKDPNIAHFYDNKCFIEMRDMFGDIVDVAIIDQEDSEKVLKHKWHVSVRGYPQARINGKLICLYTFILNEKNIDHIDRDKMNNCKNNLRKCTCVQNIHNTDSVGGTSKFKGVWYDSFNEKYCVAITSYGKRIWGGRYDNEIDAAKAFNKLSIKHHGEFGVLNDV